MRSLMLNFVIPEFNNNIDLENYSNAMEKYPVKIKSIQSITHNVVKIVAKKPSNYNFIPTQDTEVAINIDCWKDKKRPFTFTSFPADNFLQFTIKIDPSYKVVTNELQQLKKNDELYCMKSLVQSQKRRREYLFPVVWASILLFSSSGIFNLKNKIRDIILIFAKKTKDGIMLQQEFNFLLDKNFINILFLEKTNEYTHGKSPKVFLKSIFPTSISNSICA